MDIQNRLALYARVSTMDQNPEVQLAPLRAYATRRAVEALEFIDHGISGAKDSRPGLDRTMEAARRREVTGVVVTKLDRIARSVRHLTQLAAEFENLGVDLVVLDQAIDTGTPSGRLLFHVLGAIAEFERDLIRDRTQAGLAAARLRGKRLGRPSALDAAQRRRLRRLWQAGRSQREIARVLDVSKGTVHREIRLFAQAAHEEVQGAS
jgi:DNA invertase Pin-like site-specific DNA recombinase